MRVLLRIASLAVVGIAPSAFPADRPPPPFADAPSGFEWYVFEAGDSACLRPLGWFVKTEVGGDTAALFMSKEDIDKEGQFETGLTLNVVRKIHEKTGVSPSQYSRIYLEELIAEHEDAKRFENLDQNGMSGIGAVYLDQEASSPIVIYTFLLADDASDILRIFILESPREEWADVWARNEKMLTCRIRR